MPVVRSFEWMLGVVLTHLTISETDIIAVAA